MGEKDAGARQTEAAGRGADARDREIEMLRAQVSALTTNPDVGVWTWPDLAQDAVYVSENLRPLLGIPDAKDVVTSEEAFALVHREDIGRVRGKIEERLESGGMFSVEYRLTAEGSTRYARTYGDVTTYPNRAPSVVGSTAIIDRERRLGRERRRSRRSLRRVMRAGRVYPWTWPAIGSSPVTVDGVDPAARPPGASDLDDPWADYVHPDDLPLLREAMAAAVAAPGKFEREARFRLGAKGEAGAYHYYLCRGKTERLNTEQLRAEGTLVDIDERRRLVRAAEESTRRLELVMRGIRAGSWDWPDTSSPAINMSDEWFRLLEYDRDDIASEVPVLFTLVDPEHVPMLQAKTEVMFATGEPYEAEYRARFKHSGWRWVRATAAIERDVHGPGRHRVAGAITDVHERRTAELRLREANDQLQQFSYLVAHDLGAPARHVQAFAKILAEEHGDRLDADAAALTRSISEAGHRLTGMIEELLEYARTGTVELRPRPLALGPLVARARTQLSGDNRAGAVRWEIGELPTVLSDEAQLEKVFQNLFSNAIKFTAEEPEPTVRVYAAALTEHEASVVVEDNGVGFDPAQAERIFGAFERAHGRGEFSGTGIGLANVARIIGRHGGRIEAEGAVGEYARFTVTLPRG